VPTNITLFFHGEFTSISYNLNLIFTSQIIFRKMRSHLTTLTKLLKSTNIQQILRKGNKCMNLSRNGKDNANSLSPY